MCKRILVFAIASLWATTALGATLSGFVRDGQGRGVPNATVTVTCGDKKGVSGKTNGQGRFRISGLPNSTWCEASAGGRSQRFNTGTGQKEINLGM